MPKITPCIWFDTQAEEAANLYTALFPNSKINDVTHYQGKAVIEVSGKPEGSVLTVEFELDGQQFTALNGGPMFKLTEAISFVIHCQDQAEVDHYWEGLTKDGGAESQCGWCKDKFGVSWQVVPEVLEKLLSGPDSKKSEQAMAAMLEMKKLDIAALQAAYDKD